MTTTQPTDAAAGSAGKTMSVTMVSLGSWEALNDYLSAINDAGHHPDLPFVDANGNASIAHGTSPSGDDWVVTLEGPRDPDSGSVHCCECYDHGPRKCDAGLDWRPTFPIVAITAHGTAPSGDVGPHSAPGDGTATIFAGGFSADCVEVDCDLCLSSLLDGPTAAIGSGWLTQAVSDHAKVCPGDALRADDAPTEPETSR